MKKLKKMKMLIFLSSVMVFFTVNAEANDYQKELSSFQKNYQQKYQGVQEQIKKLQKKFEFLKENPNFSRQSKNQVNQFNENLTQLSQQIREADDSLKSKISQTQNQFKMYEIAKSLGENTILVDQMMIAGNHSEIIGILRKLRTISANDPKLQDQLKFLFNTLIHKIVVVIDKDEDHSPYLKYLDHNQIPSAGLIVPVWSYAKAQRDKVESVIKEKHLATFPINYAYFDYLLATQMRCWLSGSAYCPHKQPIEFSEFFWFEDSEHQSADLNFPEQEPNQEEREAENFFYSTLDFEQRTPLQRDLPAVVSSSFKFMIVNDFMKKRYEEIKSNAIRVGMGSQISPMPKFEEYIALANKTPQENFAYYYNQIQYFITEMTKIAKQMKLGELGQVAILKKTQNLETTSRQFFQEQEHQLQQKEAEVLAIKNEFDQFQSALREKLAKKLAIAEDFTSTTTLKPLTPVKLSETSLAEQRQNLATKIKENSHRKQVNAQTFEQQKTLQQQIDTVRSEVKKEINSQGQIEDQIEKLTCQLNQVEKRTTSLAKKRATLITQCVRLRDDNELDDQIKSQKLAIAKEVTQVAKLTEGINQAKSASQQKVASLSESTVAQEAEIQQLTEELRQLTSLAAQRKQDPQQPMITSAQMFDRINQVKVEVTNWEERSASLEEKIGSLVDQIANSRSEWQKMATELTKIEQDLKQTQAVIDRISGFNHFSGKFLPFYDNYSRRENISDEMIRLNLLGSLILGLDVVFDCHGLYTHDLADFLTRVLQAMAQIDFSNQAEKSLTVLIIPGRGLHSENRQANLKMELEWILAERKKNGDQISYQDVPNNPGVVAVTFGPQFVKDNPDGFKITEIEMEEEESTGE